MKLGKKYVSFVSVLVSESNNTEKQVYQSTEIRTGSATIFSE